MTAQKVNIEQRAKIKRFYSQKIKRKREDLSAHRKKRIKKGAWSTMEDKRLFEIMISLGAVTKKHRNDKFSSWKEVEKLMDGRTAKQCREHWVLNLDPSINKSDWMKWEDSSILYFQELFGNSWSKIKDLLATNRTENAVKIRYNFLRRLQKKHGVFGPSILEFVSYEDKEENLSLPSINTFDFEEIFILLDS